MLAGMGCRKVLKISNQPFCSKRCDAWPVVGGCGPEKRRCLHAAASGLNKNNNSKQQLLALADAVKQTTTGQDKKRQDSSSCRDSAVDVAPIVFAKKDELFGSICTGLDFTRGGGGLDWLGTCTLAIGRYQPPINKRHAVMPARRTEARFFVLLLSGGDLPMPRAACGMHRIVYMVFVDRLRLTA